MKPELYCYRVRHDNGIASFTTVNIGGDKVGEDMQIVACDERGDIYTLAPDAATVGLAFPHALEIALVGVGLPLEASQMTQKPNGGGE